MKENAGALGRALGERGCQKALTMSGWGYEGECGRFGENIR